MSDLGGCFSLNLRLHDLGLVLRVQQPFVSRGRVSRCVSYAVGFA